MSNRGWSSFERFRDSEFSCTLAGRRTALSQTWTQSRKRLLIKAFPSLGSMTSPMTMALGLTIFTQTTRGVRKRWPKYSVHFLRIVLQARAPADRALRIVLEP